MLVQRGWLILVLRLVVGGLFLYSGAVKLRAPQDFADSVASFQLLPIFLINPFALGLPMLEAILGALLLLKVWVRAAAFSVLGMTLMFALALGSALMRGIQVDCGCFGAGGSSTWLSLGRDLLLVAAAGVLYLDQVKTHRGHHSELAQR